MLMAVIKIDGGPSFDDRAAAELDEMDAPQNGFRS